MIVSFFPTMITTDGLQRRLERSVLFFQGGIRRSILIFGGVCVVLLVPSYFIGSFSANASKNVWFDNDLQVVTKQITRAPYSLSRTEKVDLQSQNRDLYISINNKSNTSTGVYPWIYTLQVQDESGAVIDQKKFQDYLLPGDVKYVVYRDTTGTATNLTLTEEANSKAVEYNPRASKVLKQPNVRIENKELIEKDETTLLVKGILQNDDNVFIEKMDILYILRDSQESVVGIGTYSFTGFAPGDVRDFTLEHPKPLTRRPSSLDLRWSTNYLEPNNIYFENLPQR